MPLVYNYNPDTKEFTGASRANESPREPGVFLLPANATFKPAPGAGPGQVVLWNGTDWDKIIDKRKKEWYDPSNGRRVNVNNPNADTSNLVDTKPPANIRKPKYVGNSWVEDALIYKDYVVETAQDVHAVNRAILEKDHDGYNALVAGIADNTSARWTTFKSTYDQFVIDANDFITANGL